MDAMDQILQGCVGLGDPDSTMMVNDVDSSDDEVVVSPKTSGGTTEDVQPNRTSVFDRLATDGRLKFHAGKMNFTRAVGGKDSASLSFFPLANKAQSIIRIPADLAKKLNWRDDVSVTVKVEYVWEPTQCSHCLVFRYKTATCVKALVAQKVKAKAPIVDADGFTRVSRKEWRPKHSETVNGSISGRKQGGGSEGGNYNHKEVGTTKDVMAKKSGMGGSGIKPWVIAGNFNTLLFPHDSLGGSSRRNFDMMDFSLYVEDIEVFDVRFTDDLLFLGIVKRVWDVEVEGTFMFRKDLDVVQLAADLAPFDDGVWKDLQHLCNAYQQAVWTDINAARQCAKGKWLSKGDLNTRYFHRVVKEKRHIHHIHSMCNSNGNYVYDEDVVVAFIDHFKAIISSKDVSVDATMQPFLFTNWLTVGEANHMIWPIQDQDIKHALFILVVVDCMKPALDGLISKSQSAFILGRKIVDNILMAHELVVGYHLEKGPPRCAFKIDLRKAYDVVNWDFVLCMLQGLEFHHVLINWIHEMISTPSFSIALNGESGGNFKGKRGIRLGDPLSPYFSRWLRKASPCFLSNVFGRLLVLVIIMDARSFKSLIFVFLMIYLCSLVEMLPQWRFEENVILVCYVFGYVSYPLFGVSLSPIALKPANYGGLVAKMVVGVRKNDEYTARHKEICIYGNSPNVWEDTWLQCGPLSTIIPYRLVHATSLTTQTTGHVPKHAFCMWPACLERLPTRDIIVNWKHDPVIFSVVYVRSFPCTWDAIMDVTFDVANAPRFLSRWLALAAVVYTIWCERNKRLFTGVSQPVPQLVNNIISIVHDRMAWNRQRVKKTVNDVVS
ncbi:hypothetical protein OSB04_016760 [Centaurea solstitialis]|uniref:Reverse transcriptase domain-containing protein n=1 Tax=Centaurea solstitialis TaxID=347529 RepID=A0AA38TDG9_9ASTR|nr:hypothetical protein OSB04_016760 [Centaurea solstitialis]